MRSRFITGLLLLGILSPVAVVAQSLDVSPNQGIEGQELEAVRAEAMRLLKAGQELVAQDQDEAAIVQYQRALEIYRRVGDREGEAISLARLGKLYWKLKQNEKAIDFYFQSSVAYEKAEDFLIRLQA